MTFEFATANRIIFGRGKVSLLTALAAERAKRLFVLTGGDKSRIAPFITDLQNQGLDIRDFQISGEPDTDLVIKASALARQHKADLVIAIGGGSVIDSGKAIAALLTNHGDLLDYLEVVGSGKALQNPSAPCIAVPTTAGTGSEVTRNAVLRSKKDAVKV
ncbi:iron-containing alcohol dehydrogenase, partial [candidate division KSB1 bacterium]|nr:iron-containing alcohol dehydrogenase [candidate division KSB1 bacterium]